MVWSKITKYFRNFVMPFAAIASIGIFSDKAEGAELRADELAKTGWFTQGDNINTLWYDSEKEGFFLPDNGKHYEIWFDDCKFTDSFGKDSSRFFPIDDRKVDEYARIVLKDSPRGNTLESIRVRIDKRVPGPDNSITTGLEEELTEYDMGSDDYSLTGQRYASLDPYPKETFLESIDSLIQDSEEMIIGDMDDVSDGPRPDYLPILKEFNKGSSAYQIAKSMSTLDTNQVYDCLGDAFMAGEKYKATRINKDGKARSNYNLLHMMRFGEGRDKTLGERALELRNERWPDEDCDLRTLARILEQETAAYEAEGRITKVTEYQVEKALWEVGAFHLDSRQSREAAKRVYEDPDTGISTVHWYTD